MSKKLQGNGLWESSRMLLPQHKEQSLLLGHSTGDGKETMDALPLDSRDMEMIRQYIILPIALQIVEKKQQEIEQSREMLKSLYSEAAKLLIKRIRLDISELKRGLLSKQIRVTREARDDVELRFRCMHGSRESEVTMTRNFLKDAISVALGQYTNNLIAQIRSAWSNQP